MILIRPRRLAVTVWHIRGSRSVRCRRGSSVSLRACGRSRKRIRRAALVHSLSADADRDELFTANAYRYGSGLTAGAGEIDDH